MSGPGVGVGVGVGAVAPTDYGKALACPDGLLCVDAFFFLFGFLTDV